MNINTKYLSASCLYQPNNNDDDGYDDDDGDDDDDDDDDDVDDVDDDDVIETNIISNQYSLRYSSLTHMAKSTLFFIHNT